MSSKPNFHIMITLVDDDERMGVKKQSTFGVTEKAFPPHMTRYKTIPIPDDATDPAIRRKMALQAYKKFATMFDDLWR